MSNVENLFPCDDFITVAAKAAQEIESGIIIGLNKEGELTVYGGGLIEGRPPVIKDWLWFAEAFKFQLMSGEYNDEG